MPGFLYFVPGAKADAERALGALAPHALEPAGGGGPAFNQVSIPEAEAAGGPSGSGYVVGRPGFYLYARDAQEWQKAPVRVPDYEGPPYWIGYQKDAPPGPQDLARDKQIAGYQVELGDGRKWLVPVARRYCESEHGLRYVSALPAPRLLSPSGAWTRGEVCPRYREIWKISTRFGEALERASKDEADAFDDIDFQDESDYLVRVIAANYRIGPAEASALGLLIPGSAAKIVLTLLDSPGLKELRKKLEAPGGGFTSPGAEA